MSDRSETVFTALVRQIGGDTVEICAAPTPTFLVNGLPFEDGAQPEGDLLMLPGGGHVTPEGTDTPGFAWPESSFALSVTVHAGSHQPPGIRIDASLTYEGPARFMADWMLDGAVSGFSVPLGADPTCNCAE
ncbi:hypothetical protein [Maliponia aquimaris]|uniref:Uncharacterized protein n=1 Tax=Maliponia aquimaris TaxID=1673631 RepID=A0A238K725_9RHOB|nr:hypothetical protein [Maliponia aquimaris]SMX38615.1 hypothetical protein MAA8898_01632 [Maliponia aquimaris]